MNYDQEKYPMIWKRTTSKGYCFTARIPCRMIRNTGKRIEIAALLIGGKERIHRVEPSSLVHDPCHCFAECKAISKLDGPKYVTIASGGGRAAMAQVVRFSDPSPILIETVILQPQPGHADFGLHPEDEKWSLDTGWMIPHETSDIEASAWKISATDLGSLRQRGRDLLRGLKRI